MGYVSTLIGGAICGALCFGIWPEMWKSYGIMGGWITATVVIGICWYMNHWVGVFWNRPGRIWVDQGWAVAAAGVAWAMVRFNAPFQRALPTIFCCLLGGALAGVAAVHVKKHHLASAGPSQTPGPEGSSHG